VNNELPFDATYGYTLDSLLKVQAPPEPAGFETFWRETYDQARALPLNIASRQVASADAKVDLYEVEFDSWDGVRIGGWMTAPAGAAASSITRGMVVGHGYGGREQPDYHLPGPACAAIMPCARWFHRSAKPGFPSNSEGHVQQGIESKETYSHRGSAADLWAAASALLELFPGVAGNLDYLGGSFGGGMGALMLPWDDRFRRAALDVPSHGNYPLRVKLTCGGSGDAVQKRYWRDPGIMEVLAYHDAAIAAGYISIPTLVSPALMDPAVPPPGQFCVYNAIPGAKQLFVRRSGHMEQSSDEIERLWTHQDAFFS
jgi:cephalosporin-C deacetylase